MNTLFLNILEQKYAAHPLREPLMAYTTQLLDFYEANRAESTRRFKAFLDKYQNMEHSGEVPHLTLFTGSGIHEYCPCLDYDGDITDDDEEIGTIVAHPEIDIDFNPSGEEEEYAWVDLYVPHHRAIVLTWLSTIWQEIKGQDYGLIVKTLENNSISEYYFNDFAHDDRSAYYGIFDSEHPVTPHFTTDLSLEDIYLKVID